MKITRKQIRQIIKEAAKEGEAGVFGSGMEQADLDKDEKKIIGHTWLTHAKVQDESLRRALGISGNPTGKVIHHDLKSDGTITYYNIKINESTYTHIPARMVEAVMTEVHEHEEKDWWKLGLQEVNLDWLFKKQ